MEKEIKKVLNVIEKNGFEAYIVGGYVRDLLLKKSSYDVDICTNALPKELISLFPNGNTGIYGAVDFKIGKYSFEITTYRKEYNYQNRHPNKIEYINNLLEDINRRDFKINTLCLNSRGNIIDLLNGYADIERKTISAVGDPSEKIKEDPLRIIRAIRFATVLDFSIDEALLSAIKSNVDLVSTLSDYRLIDEITKILISDNYAKGFQMMEDLGILDIIGLSYKGITKTKDINGMWAQIEMQKELAFNKETKHNINTIKKIVEIGIIDNRVLYDHGLYYSMVAGEILKIDRHKINSMYKKLPIKSIKDIALPPKKIIEVADLKQNDDIKVVLDILVDQLLNNQIKNNPKDIYKYLQSYKER